MGMPMSKLVISVSAITVATIAWYSWPSKKRESFYRRSKYPIIGLENAGSSCFLNAILQALASLKHFEKWLERQDIGNEIAKDSIPPKFHGLKYPVIAILYRTVLVVNRVVQKDEYVLASKLPVILTNVLRRRGQNIMLTEEQDAVEIMQLIFGAVIDDVISIEIPQKTGSLACFELESNPQSITLEKVNTDAPATETSEESPPLYQNTTEQFSVAYRVHGHALIKLAVNLSQKPTPPFKGLIASKLECVGCFKRNPISTESFDILSLSLPPVPVKSLTLNKLIEDYLKPTLVHGVDCDECSRTSGVAKKSTFVKSLAFGRVPKVLCLHIMRTSWSGADNRLSKRLDHVMFSTKLDMTLFKSIKDLTKKVTEGSEESHRLTKEDLIMNILRMKPLCLENWEPYYELKAVICHEGDVDNGHYITLRKCPQNNNTWYNVSDDIITTVSTEYVLSSRAYVLFYEYVAGL